MSNKLDEAAIIKELWQAVKDYGLPVVFIDGSDDPWPEYISPPKIVKRLDANSNVSRYVMKVYLINRNLSFTPEDGREVVFSSETHRITDIEKQYSGSSIAAYILYLER